MEKRLKVNIDSFTILMISIMFLGALVLIVDQCTTRSMMKDCNTKVCPEGHYPFFSSSTECSCKKLDK
jgi:hypothetical protein